MDKARTITMNETSKVYEFADGEVTVWYDGCICIKTRNKFRGCPRKRYLFASLIQLLRVEKSFAGEP